MFFKYQYGLLDQNVMMRLRLNNKRMRDPNGDPDSLFFYFMLLSLHHINKDKGILPTVDDPRHLFSCEVAKFTNLGGVGELDLGSRHEYHFQTTTAAKMVQWDGVLVMDGIRAGNKGEILRRFLKYQGSKLHDEGISKAFTKSCWLELKRTIKICNNLASPKKEEDDYDPTYKYDFIF